MLAQDTSTHVHGEGEGGTVIATASAKPFIPPVTDNNKSEEVKASEKVFKRQPGTDTALAAYAELPKWEILCTCVEPTLQGRGIAGKLLGLTIEEIKRRVMESKDEGHGRRHGGDGELNGEGETHQMDEEADADETKEEAKGEVLLMLSSMQELNESYYAKRGWQTTGVRRFPPGTLGSRDGFGVVEMMKVVSL